MQPAPAQRTIIVGYDGRPEAADAVALATRQADFVVLGAGWHAGSEACSSAASPPRCFTEARARWP